MTEEQKLPDWTEQEWCDVIENLLQEIRDEFNTISVERDYWLLSARQKAKTLVYFLERYRQHRKQVDSHD